MKNRDDFLSSFALDKARKLIINGTETQKREYTALCELVSKDLKKLIGEAAKNADKEQLAAIVLINQLTYDFTFIDSLLGYIIRDKNPKLMEEAKYKIRLFRMYLVVSTIFELLMLNTTKEEYELIFNEEKNTDDFIIDKLKKLSKVDFLLNQNEERNLYLYTFYKVLSDLSETNSNGDYLFSSEDFSKHLSISYLYDAIHKILFQLLDINIDNYIFKYEGFKKFTDEELDSVRYAEDDMETFFAIDDIKKERAASK